MLSRASHLERVSRWLARQDQETQVRLARELVTACRSLNRRIAELDQRTAEIALVAGPADALCVRGDVQPNAAEFCFPRPFQLLAARFSLCKGIPSPMAPCRQGWPPEPAGTLGAAVSKIARRR
jgi:hypothetical protein